MSASLLTVEVSDSTKKLIHTDPINVQLKNTEFVEEKKLYFATIVDPELSCIIRGKQASSLLREHLQTFRTSKTTYIPVQLTQYSVCSNDLVPRFVIVHALCVLDDSRHDDVSDRKISYNINRKRSSAPTFSLYTDDIEEKKREKIEKKRKKKEERETKVQRDILLIQSTMTSSLSSSSSSSSSSSLLSPFSSSSQLSSLLSKKKKTIQMMKTKRNIMNRIAGTSPRTDDDKSNNSSSNDGNGSESYRLKMILCHCE